MKKGAIKVIKIKNLSHSFGEKKVLENIDLQIPNGCILGVVGINGAGKSTLLRLMCGVYEPEDGSIAYDEGLPSLPDVREKIFFLPDDPYYTANATCRSVVEMYKVFYPQMDMGVYEQFMEKFKLDQKKHIRNFSKGMKRQFYIALALAVKPKYLLLDEAFDGLDPLARKYFKEAIIQYVEKEDTTVVISSHSLRELESFCDSFVLIDNKSVKACGSIAEKVESMCKFQLAFLQEINREMFSSLPAASIEQNGKFVQIVLRCNAQKGKELIDSLPVKPAVFEEMQMNFEEVFINEVEGENANG